MEADPNQVTGNNSKTSSETIVGECNSPEATTLSPLGKSRYGRTRKPKITEDFYDIDAILDSVKETTTTSTKKSPRANNPPIKVSTAAKPTKPQQQNAQSIKTKTNLTTPVKSVKAKHFVHITGDSPDDPVTSPSNKLVERNQSSPLNSSNNNKSVRKFFKTDSSLSSPSSSSLNVSIESNKSEDVINNINSEITQLSDDSVDVTKVLKIISTKSPDRLQNNVDPKGSVKAVLKTYSNKRRNFQKPAVVESFGLPDTPIFPIESEKVATTTNEPKRIKNLDLATQCSESDVNIVDKKLLDTPWKITSITSGFPDSGTLLGTYCDDAEDEDTQLYDEDKNQNELEVFPFKPNEIPVVKDSLEREETITKEDTVVKSKLSKVEVTKEGLLDVCNTSSTSKGTIKDDTAAKGKSPKKQIIKERFVNINNVSSVDTVKEDPIIVESKSPKKQNQRSAEVDTTKEDAVIQSKSKKHVTNENVDDVMTVKSKSPKKHITNENVTDVMTVKSKSPQKHIGNENVADVMTVKSKSPKKHITNENVADVMTVKSKSPKKHITNENVADVMTVKSKSPKKHITNENVIDINDTDVKTVKSKSSKKQTTNEKSLDVSNVTSVDTVKEDAVVKGKLSKKQINKKSSDDNDASFIDKTKESTGVKNNSPKKLITNEQSVNINSTSSISKTKEVSIVKNKLSKKKLTNEHLVKVFTTSSPEGITVKNKSPKKQIINEQADNVNNNSSMEESSKVGLVNKKSNKVPNSRSPRKQNQKQGSDDLTMNVSPRNSKRGTVAALAKPVSRDKSPKKQESLVEDNASGKILKKRPDNVNVADKLTEESPKKLPLRKQQDVTNDLNKLKERSPTKLSLRKQQNDTDDLNKFKEKSPIKLSLKKQQDDVDELSKLREKSPSKQSLKKHQNDALTPTKESLEASEETKETLTKQDNSSASKKCINPFAVKNKQVIVSKTPSPVSTRVLRSVNLEPTVVISPKSNLRSTSPKKVNKLENNEVSNGSTKREMRKSNRISNLEQKNEMDIELLVDVKSEIDDINDEIDEMNLLNRSRLYSTNKEVVDLSNSIDNEVIKIKQEDDVVMESDKLAKVSPRKSKSRKSSLSCTIVKPEPANVQLGDLMWARVGGHPYWPCLVTNDPFSNEYVNVYTGKKYPGSIYHVRFFGDKGRRCWVSSTSILPYNDQNDLKTLQEKLKVTTKNNAVLLQPYVIRSHQVSKWKNAVAEAESLRLCSVQERFDFFFNMFASEKEKIEKVVELETPEVETPTTELETKEELIRLETSEVEKADILIDSKSPDINIKKRKRGRPRKDENIMNSQNSELSLDSTSITTDSLDSSLVSPEKTKKRRVVSEGNNMKVARTKSLISVDLVNESETVIKNEKENDNDNPDVTLKQSENNGKNSASKGNSKKGSRESSVDESSSEMFFKNPWQVFDIPKRQLSTPLNEVNSECSLSDTDSMSKSSTNVPVPNTYQDQVARHKKNNLFRGVRRHRVCQVCQKYGEVLRCKGPCNGLFHNTCSNSLLSNNVSNDVNEEKKENDDESESSESSDNKTLITATPAIAEKTKPENNDINEVEILNKTNKANDQAQKIESKQDKKADNNKVEIVRVDCDDSDLEHTLTPPKVRLTPNKDYNTLTLAEKIDMKMKEIMQKFEARTRYADSTTDSSSEEGAPNILPLAEKAKVVQKKKVMKIKHVTADNISEYSSSEDLTGEGNSTKSSSQDASNTESNKQGVSSTANIENTNQSIIQKDESNSIKNKKNHDNNNHVAGESDLPPDSETNSNNKEFKCSYCIADIDPPCFVCKKEVSNKNVSFRQKCSLHMCGKFYHPECLKIWPQTQWSLISTAKPRNSNMHFDTFACPMHVCHTCASDDPHAAISRVTSDKVVKCLECPATYHISNHCVPAGTVILSTSQIICPRHLGQRIVKRGGKSIKLTRTINTPWCFICSKGGELICCETCPTSVHTDCLQVNLLEDGTFICEDCESGRFPLYDEIVWVKLGAYRWWPALILFPSEIPENLKNKPHSKGEFVVKFFGTHDHYWVARGRVFLFQEGDRGHCSPTKKKVDALFKKSIEEATAAHQLKKIFRMNKEAEIKTGLKPPPYIRIKVNKPVGNVRLFDGNISNTTPCECDPNQANPCGPDSDCLNRLLLTECDPAICPAKERCNNQRFEKREYPPIEPFKTPARGWGLKTLAPIRKGDFVIEYVGEVIDEQEYQRRIRKMHEQKDENYYFLTIDKDRLIDAGPKGNLARFMNHCCQPNCETQKWTVNGDTRVGLFAKEDIAADTELTFNYHLECIGKEKKICKCGAPNCSGFIGVKAKVDESQKKPKKTNNLKKRKSIVLQQTSKNDGPCFICGQPGDVGACHNKICTKFYHLQCINLECWPEGKWVCPWHNCNVCSKRTIRCCVKCINSYCPVHSEGNVRYDKLLGFICSEHDPTKESHEVSNQNVSALKNNSISSNTKETDVTSTTPDEMDSSSPPSTEAINIDEMEPIEDQDLNLAESVTSTPIKSREITSFVVNLKDFENGIDPEMKLRSSPNIKKKRGRQKRNSGSPPKRARLSNNEAPKPNYVTSNLLNMPAQNEIKLSPSIPTRHLRTTRSNVDNSNVETKRFLSRQSELEKDLPIRKRSRPRCEASL